MTFAIVKFVLDRYLFNDAFEPIEFVVKSTLLGSLIFLLSEWESRYRQARDEKS